jgi:hypothetical protein
MPGVRHRFKFSLVVDRLRCVFGLSAPQIPRAFAMNAPSHDSATGFLAAATKTYLAQSGVK